MKFVKNSPDIMISMIDFYTLLQRKRFFQFSGIFRQIKQWNTNQIANHGLSEFVKYYFISNLGA